MDKKINKLKNSNNKNIKKNKSIINNKNIKEINNNK